MKKSCPTVAESKVRTIQTSETGVQLVSTTPVPHTLIRASGLPIILVLGFTGNLKGELAIIMVLGNTHLDRCGGNFYKT